MNASVEVSLSPTVADVLDLNNYFEFGNEAKFFEYTNEGIVHDFTINTSSQSQEGDIEIPFQINVGKSKIQEHLAIGSSGFSLQTVLIDKNDFDFFSLCSGSNSKLALNDTGIFLDSDFLHVASSKAASDKEMKSVFDLSSFAYLSSSKVYFAVRYTLSFTTDNFKKSLFICEK